MKVTMQELNAALEEVRVVAASKHIDEIDFVNDTPLFNQAVESIILEGLEGVDGTDATVAQVTGALKAALLSVPRVVNDIHNERVATSAKPGNDHRYATFAAMGRINKQSSAEKILNTKLNGMVEALKAEMQAAAAAAPAPALVP